MTVQLLSGTEVIDRGIVRMLRSTADLVAPLRGGIHESLSSRQVKYPYLLYALVSAPFVQDWGSGSDKGQREIRALYDISALATNQPEANNLAALIDTLFGASPSKETLDQFLDGQTCTYCAVVATPPMGPDKDDEGRYYVQKGRTVEVWTVQPIP